MLWLITEDERFGVDEEEEYAISSKPKILGDDVVRCELISVQVIHVIVSCGLVMYGDIGHMKGFVISRGVVLWSCIALVKGWLLGEWPIKLFSDIDHRLSPAWTAFRKHTHRCQVCLLIVSEMKIAVWNQFISYGMISTYMKSLPLDSSDSK